MLNERSEKTKKIIHLMVTTLCKRKCPHCCNNQYDLKDIPYVTDEELKEAETLCITGGEPFAFTDPNEIAKHYKTLYPNIKNVYVYGNVLEFVEYLKRHGAGRYRETIENIDGLSLSIKSCTDLIHYVQLVSPLFNNGYIFEGKSNRVYYFNDEMQISGYGIFDVIKREWQEEFTPADDSIFRRA